jgi:hypothetical protein
MIPLPLNLCIPQSWSLDDILFCRKPMMGPRETLRRLSVDDYWSLLKRAQLLSGGGNIGNEHLSTAPKREEEYK